MTSFIKSPVQGLDYGYFELSGSFQCNGVTGILLPKGPGFVATRTGAGAFLITISEKFLEFISGGATLQLNAAAAQYCQLGAVDVTAKTVVIRVPGGADVAAHEFNRVNFTFLLRYM